MRKFTVNLLSLSLGLALMPLAQAVNSPQQQQLLEQVRLGNRRSVKIWCVSRSIVLS